MKYKKIFLKDILEEKGYIRGPFGSALRRAELKSEGIPVYEQQNAIYNHRNFRYFIDEKKFEELRRFQVKTNDLIISCSGTVGRVSKIKENDEKGIISQALLTLRPDVEIINPDYLYYFFVSKEGRHSLLSRSSGSVQVNIAKRNIIENIPLPLPEKKIQKKIVDILNSLDSKIEVNNQIISNLEELAATLFKRWFVDFEFPDENGNPYKSSGGKMVDSELGEIPEGWEIIKLSDLVVQIKETFNPNKTEVEKVNHFSIPNFDSKKFPVIENVNTIKSNKTKITDFTVLFSKMNPNFERVWLTELNKSYLNVCSPEFIALDCKNINLQTYTYFLCKSTAFNRFLVNNATGSTGSRQRIKPSIAMGFKFVGAVDLINQYGEICSGISEQIMNLRNQIENLEEMRDALLPKLLSGEIELPEDEEA
ncbi:restriction endonuclease subunit S [Enterococcus faecium]|uniref:restriction endonuclease subunit S n=1 Tax=Enterococcus faecium TaxID=1352 RepID=UPI00209080BA|nr:restriction endonuclease subunit S [Enterococcus faecium]MCO5463090.1 restriction endonuclease subunit S [Enterococcus faecium]